ncbi:MAG: ClbS/DfsB family four-helix bundle protein [Anaerolineae bacterium]|nr:ClbS/DfsB family four-helix bundle protein [Anaerolineae bacterium]
MAFDTRMDKQRLLDLNRVEHDFLRRTVELLPPEMQTTAEIMPDWTVKDILAHVTGWEQHFIAQAEAATQGDPVDRPVSGYTEEVIDRMNAASHAASKDTPLDEVMAAFERSFFAFQRTISRLPDEALFTPGYFDFTGKHCLYQFAEANGWHHYREHAEMIRAWLAAQEAAR